MYVTHQCMYVCVCYTCAMSGLCIEVCICVMTEGYIPLHPPPPPPPDPYSHEWSDYFQVHFVDFRRKEWDDLLFYVVRDNKVRTYVRSYKCVCTYVCIKWLATSNTYSSGQCMLRYCTTATTSVCPTLCPHEFTHLRERTSHTCCKE